MRNRTRQLATIVILLASFLLSTVTLAAQSATNDWSRLTSVESGSKLRVKLKSGKNLEGTLSSVSDTALTLMIKNTSTELTRNDVLTVHHVIKKSTTTPTLIGLGVGAGAGAVVGAVSDSNDNGFEKIDNAVTATLTVLGAGVGALSGFLIGRSGKKQVLIYDAK